MYNIQISQPGLYPDWVIEVPHDYAETFLMDVARFFKIFFFYLNCYMVKNPISFIPCSKKTF